MLKWPQVIFPILLLKSIFLQPNIHRSSISAVLQVSCIVKLCMLQKQSGFGSEILTFVF
jgi:hypothetical protein